MGALIWIFIASIVGFTAATFVTRNLDVQEQHLLSLDQSNNNLQYISFDKSPIARESTLILLMIAPGLVEIPPIGYGAVESIIWNYFQELPSHGFDVTVVNTLNANEVMNAVNEVQPDIIHIQIESWAYFADKLSAMTSMVIITFHGPLFSNPSRWNKEEAANFKSVSAAIRLLPNVFFFVICPKHSDVLLYNWFIPPEKIFLLPNGVDTEQYRMITRPNSPSMAITVGKIDARKGQYFLQSFMPPGEISFIGPHGNCQQFDFSDPNYLGPWTKQQLHETLTEFGNLVHLATDEGAPLVVLEALAAGLGVVTTVNASPNLDITKPFITVIPEEKIYDTEYILAAIRKNREVSLTMREEIREYARQTFSWKEVIVPQYASLVRKLLSEQESYGLSSRSASWASKYALTNVDNSKHRVTGVPYIGVVSLLHSVSGSIMEWIDTLRVLGVDYFLFYTVHSNDDKMLPLLKDYIAEGVVEVQYMTDFAYYDSLDDTGKMNIFEDKYFHILCLNEAVAYFRLVGITWHIVLYEQDYLFENGKYSGMVRNGVRKFLKRLESVGSEILVAEGTAIMKVHPDVSVLQDDQFMQNSASRSFVKSYSVYYLGLLELACAHGRQCSVSNVDGQIGFVAIAIGYCFELERRGGIKSADEEIKIIVDQLNFLSPNVANLKELSTNISSSFVEL